MGSALVSLLGTDDLADFFLLPSAPNGRLGRKHSRSWGRTQLQNMESYSSCSYAHHPQLRYKGPRLFLSFRKFSMTASLPERLQQGLLWDPSVSPQPVKKPGQLFLYTGKSNPQSLDAVLLSQDADLEGHIIALDMTYSKETFIPSYVWQGLPRCFLEQRGSKLCS